jgi:23S rRNA pseudouridine2604 synthase
MVTGLKRVRSGSVSLGPLPVSRWRYLRRDEKF